MLIEFLAKVWRCMSTPIRLSPSGRRIAVNQLPFVPASPDQQFAGPVVVPVGPAVSLFAGISAVFPEEITQAMVWFTAERTNAAAGGTGLYVLTVDGLPSGGSGRTVGGTTPTEAAIAVLVGGLAAGPHVFNVDVTATVGVETVAATNLVVQPVGFAPAP